MEGEPEKQWRHDAIWAVIVIVAAISFILTALGHLIRRHFEKPGPPPIPEEPEQLLAGLALIMLIAGLIALVGYVLALSMRLRIFPDAQLPPVPWTLWDVAKAAAASYLGAGLATHAVATLAGKGGEEPSLAVLSTLFVHVAMLVAVAAFVKARGAGTRQLGLTRRHWLPSLLHGILGYLAILPIFYGAVLVSRLLMDVLRVEAPENPIIDALQYAGSAWLQWAIVVIVAVFGPFAEEVLFRGFLYPAMRRKMPVAVAVLLNAALFSLIHVSFVDFLPILVLGVGMAFLYEKTGSLVSCTVFHVLNNSLRMVVYYIDGK